MEPAEAFDRDVDERLHLIGVAHVGSLERRPLAQRRGDRLALLDVDVGDDDARPFGDQQFGGGLADGAGAAGHDRDLSGELLAATFWVVLSCVPMATYYGADTTTPK